MQKWVYGFGAGRNDGRAEMRDLLGGKGANLAEMASIGLPVPPGFTITTEECVRYLAEGGDFSAERRDEVAKALTHIERAVGKKFGDAADPLLVSVRSGARVSMPATAGMSSERAMMATWLEAPPLEVANPTTLVRSSCAVSEGVSSSAMRIVPGCNSGFLERWPVISSSTRWPTSRRSFARSERISSVRFAS